MKNNYLKLSPTNECPDNDNKASDGEVLRNEEHSFIAITAIPLFYCHYCHSTLTRSGSTYKGLIYGSNRTV